MFIAVTLFSLLNACLLFASSGKRNRGNIYLANLFLWISLRGFTSGTTLLALHPTLQKIFFNNLLPLFFLFGPLIYFYVRYEMLEIPFKLKRDFKHLLVFSMSFINVIPYYLSSNAFKESLLALTSKNQLYFLHVHFWMVDSAAYYAVGPIHTLFYLTLSLYTISNRNKELSNKLSAAGFDQIIKWLYRFITIFYAFTITNLIFSIYILITGNLSSILLPLVTGIIFLYLNIEIYNHPQVLFGIKFSKSPNANPIVHIKKIKPIIVLETSFEIKFNQKMEQYQVKKAYNTSEFTMAFIAKDLKVPVYILNDYFKNQLKVKFIDFRNEYRIKDFCATITIEDFQRYTANAIANRFGFSHIKSLKKAFDTCQPESYEAFHSKLTSN